MNKEQNASGPNGGLHAKETTPEVEEWVPLSVREARCAREMRDDLWPYVWMNFVSMILLFAAAVIIAYRMGAQSCH
jgi:hypothetical protein